MNCDEVVALLAADADGEIDSLRSHALRKHVAGCALCGLRQQAVLDLKQRLHAELPHHAAPAALRARLIAEHTAAAPHPPPPPHPHPKVTDRRWRWFGAGLLSGGLAAGLVWGASLALLPLGLGDDLSSRLVGLHTRATLGNQLIEVASSDRHKVKPWLSARLDYSIPVIDGSQAGFPLAGARIEQLGGQPMATLVYRRRDHVIDVFVRPDTKPARSLTLHAVRGFNVAAAKGAELQWLAVSDLRGPELETFVQGLARGEVTAQSE